MEFINKKCYIQKLLRLMKAFISFLVFVSLYKSIIVSILVVFDTELLQRNDYLINNTIK